MTTTSKWILGVVVLAVIVWVGMSVGNKTSPETGSIKIGAVLPLTGNLAFIGEDYKQGMELAANKFETDLIIQDGEADPVKSLNAAGQLEQAGVDMILSAFRGASLSIGSSYGNKSAGPLIFATTATSKKQPIGELGPNFFAIGAEMITSGESAGIHAQGVCKRAANLTESTDAGRDKVEGFAREFGETGVVYSDVFSPDTTDFRTLILKIKSANTECMFVEVRSNAMVILLKQMEELGVKIPIYTTSYSVNADVVQQSPKAQIENVLFSSTKLYNQTRDQKEFFETYVEEYGEEPNDFAAIGYEMVRIVGEISGKCENDKECIRETLQDLNQESIVGPLVTDEYQEIKLTEYDLFGVKDGIIKIVE